ncbi:MAG: hypothetical protein K6T63_12675 [Alicyclobacillus herbarius]|uniref:hypothetical protein n=1 Tax=Alicyclobacillus herbarius TaxID=122960 RepID=UPI0004181E1E|nr:hypothetical protein [Alicyclobacillus herbarius]MCL6633471.1 hypothetical protein [Alicyclobacillus herbarius]
MLPVSHVLEVSETLETLRQIWYSYAEGYISPVTGTELDDPQLEELEARLPKGWTLSIMPRGDVLAGRPIMLNGEMQLVICHVERDGRPAILQRPL